MSVTIDDVRELASTLPRSYEVLVETNPPGGLEPATIGPDDPDPGLETFPVAVEQQYVVLYLGQSQPARQPAPEAGASTPASS